MKERQFCDFEITHFLWYKFGHHSRKFIEPLLQLRHEMKKEGNLPAAEVLKLILNGAYGYVKNCFLCLYSVIYIHFVVSNVYLFLFFFCSYKILQSSDYDDTRLLTGENLCRQRARSLAHLSLKHISLLGVVRIKLKKKKKKANKKSVNTRVSVPLPNHYLFDEAVAAEKFNSDDDDEDELLDSANENVLDYDFADSYNAEGELIERGLSESEEDSDSDDDDEEEEDNEEVEANGDLTEQIVREQEEEEMDDSSCSSSSTASGKHQAGDHNYALAPPEDVEKRKVPKERNTWTKKKTARYRYSFLYSMVVSGVGKQIKNCIPRGVGILSNSKTIILSHVHNMLECLDPGLAEICYMDTDSCIFSFTHQHLEDNLLPEKRDKWAALDIIADESGHQSCHGKMKLEGTFKVGLFKALKIYRLFSSAEFEKERREKTCYTRCKGVNRNIATLIPNKVFDQEALNQVVIHRSCLRPTRTGEMIIAHECKSLAAPFNLKRFVTSDGIHTFPISFFPDSLQLTSTTAEDSSQDLRFSKFARKRGTLCAGQKNSDLSKFWGRSSRSLSSRLWRISRQLGSLE